jgi:hypothetical protein
VPEASSLPDVGAVVGGKYRVVRPLGQGGMGAVYEAVQINLDRPVALKLLKPDLAAEPEYRRRFEREARAAALLTSPHAVRVFDVDSVPAGHMYMVMELLAGQDLHRATAKGGMEVRDLCAWIVQACEALEEAHEHGIVHRDIKPQNIFLADTEAGRIAKVLDFGISKFPEHLTKKLTKPHDGILGTPHYMSPEQLRMRRVDARTDIWSLGVMLYRILAGRWPFDAHTEADYMVAIVADAPVPLERLRPDLPKMLVAAVMRALEKEPEERFGSAGELALVLGAFSRRAPDGGVRATTLAPGAAVETVAASAAFRDTEPMANRTATLALPQAHDTIVDPPRRSRRVVPIVAACAVVAVGVTFAIARRTPEKAPTPQSSTNERVPSVEVAPAETALPLPPPASAAPTSSSRAHVQRGRPAARPAASSATSSRVPDPDFVPEHL